MWRNWRFPKESYHRLIFIKLDFVPHACCLNLLRLPIVNIATIASNNSTSNLKSHCFFLGNCIGERNWKSFYIFLTFGVLKGLYGCMICLFSGFKLVNQNWEYFVMKFSTLKYSVAVNILVYIIISYISENWAKKARWKLILGNFIFTLINIGFSTRWNVS